MVILRNAEKIQQAIFFVYLFHWGGGKLYKKNSLFCFFFLAAHYVAEAYMSKYFLLWAKVFFKDFSGG